MGGITGMNYSGVEIVIRAFKYELDLLFDVQDIEQGALEAIRNGR